VRRAGPAEVPPLPVVDAEGEQRGSVGGISGLTARISIAMKIAIPTRPAPIAATTAAGRRSPASPISP